MGSVLDKIEDELQDVSESNGVSEVVPEVVSEVNNDTELVSDAVEASKSFPSISEKAIELNSYLNKYPDKDISDYQMLKKSSNSLSDLDILRLYYSDKVGINGEELSKKINQHSDIDLDIDEFDEDYDDKIDIINGYKEDVNSAREWWDGHVSDVLGSLEKPIDLGAMTENAVNKARENYLSILYSGIPDYNSESISIGSEAIDFIPDEEYKGKLRQLAENPDVLYSSFQKEDGVLSDTKGWFDMLSWADRSLRERKISFLIEQAILRDRISQDNTRRNITTNVNNGGSGSKDLDDEFQEYLTDKLRRKF